MAKAMKGKTVTRKRSTALTGVALAGLLLGQLSLPATAATYAIELLAAQGRGFDMNRAGTAIGSKNVVESCFPSYPACLGEDVVSVFPPGVAPSVPLPAPPGRSELAPRAINEGGWIAGTASDVLTDFAPQAVVWRPGVGGYTVQELGNLPGNTIASVAGIDDNNRVVGYNTTRTFPPLTAVPFLWDPVGGLQNLAAQGFPNDIPLAISPAGTVGLTRQWYRLDGGPGSVTPNAPPPRGFTPEAGSADINDGGDQARFLLTTGSQNLAYMFRYVAAAGLWQQLSLAPSGRLTRHGVGSIDNRRTITGTIQSTGVIAPGPSGLAQSLTAQLSPAYSGAAVVTGGARNASGKILAQVVLGRSSGRLARLIPVKPCTASCIRIASLQLTAKPVTTCRTRNEVSAALIVTDELGRRLPGVAVSGRFLDDYWLDQRVSGTSDVTGTVRFTHRGPGCVGAIAFLVDRARSAGKVFDRIEGKLTDFVIPAP